MDVVAPGVDIYTTYIHGSLGYNIATGPTGDYHDSFGGTSAAAPHVAGVAALVLSVHPRLTVIEVRRIILSTCQKINPSIYTSNTSNGILGTWNNEVGYGLVDAGAAVAKATSTPRLVVGGSLARFSPVTLTWENAPAGSMSFVYVIYPQRLSSIRKQQSGTLPFTFFPSISGTYTIKAFLVADNYSPYIDEPEICIGPAVETAWIEGPTTIAPGETGTYRLRTASQTSLEPLEGGQLYPNWLFTHSWSYDHTSLERVDSALMSITLKSIRTPDPTQLPETVTIRLGPDTWFYDIPPDELVEYSLDITLTN